MSNRLPFARHEFIDRLTSMKQEMTRRGFDVAVLMDPSNIYYLTGYSGLSAYVPQGLIVDVEQEEPIFVTRMMDVKCAYHTAFMRPENVIGYPEDMIANQTGDGTDFLLDVMRGRGLLRRRIAVEKGSNQLTLSAWDKFSGAGAAHPIGDCTRLVTWLRLVKSPAEIAYMRQAGQIADGAIMAAVDAIRPGVRQCDVGAAILAAQARGLPGFGGDHAIQPNIGIGPTTDSPHLTWTDAPYQLGQATTLELGGSRFRYVSGVSRTIQLGKAPRELVDLHEVTVAGMEAAAEAARPGRVCGDVWDAYDAVIKPSRFRKTSRIGYSIGIDWLEWTASLQSGNRTELVPNMTFHMICGMWEQEGWGYVLSETFLVGANGVESLSRLPRQLVVVA